MIYKILRLLTLLFLAFLAWVFDLTPFALLLVFTAFWLDIAPVGRVADCLRITWSLFLGVLAAMAGSVIGFVIAAICALIITYALFNIRYSHYPVDDW